ncbi:VOC family protein [Anderseniella sp. Alg231-50]|uniref:VOC family protein n=1 Tax=Anderseniella sp. Alg231-50 TaxID=1922226 RepID=UPI000D554958
MTVKRIVANIAANQVGEGHKFYSELLGLKVVMDHGWIVTFAADRPAPVQVSVASEGGSGTPVPDISIEVDDVDQVHQRAKALGFDITYPLTNEPWGVRRFFVRDPFDKLVNIISHTG